jgi:hypothetical protein
MEEIKLLKKQLLLSKLRHEFFIGKIVEEIGYNKTIHLLKEVDSEFKRPDYSKIKINTK